jgi:FtsZ-binding cell division protein ZapB
MMTRLMSLVTMGLLAGALALGSTAMGGEQKARPDGAARGKLLQGNHGQMIENHIKHLEDAIAKHPNMPADLKAALEKLITDLKDRKVDVEKLQADAKAGNKEAVQADIAELRKDRAQLIQDRIAVVTAIINRMQTRLAEHPSAPADVKAAVEKLITDLKDRLADLKELANDVQAGNKDEVKADRGELKADHEQIKKDRQALRAALQAHRGEWQKKAAEGKGAK